MSTESGAASRLPRSNSVERADGQSEGSEESRSYEEKVIEDAKECVATFREEYPYLADLPISKQPGQQLRHDLVDAEYRSEYVGADNEWESGFTVERLDRHEVATWAEALFTFLVERQPYDDGVGGQFREVETGETFVVDFQDCWTTEYGEEQAARNSGAQRQLMGGMYPDEEDSARALEFEDNHEWTGDTATIMLTRTGSSTPEGGRVPPVDHAEKVVKTWSQGGVYDTVRNVCEYELGLDSDEWGYVRGDDVHGMGAHDGPGENACYPHAHDAIYIDLGATDLRDEFDMDFEIKAVLENQFYKAIEKHVESCDIAKPEAHTKEEAIEVRLDLENPSGYATEYLRLDEDEMMDMPTEFQAFAAVEWATNRQRIARSKLFNDAAKADFCKQDSDVEHGERLMYDRGGHGDAEVVCAHCESGVGIDSDTITGYRLSNPPEDTARMESVEEVVQVGAAVGESTGSARARSRAESYVDEHGEPESVAVLMGELGIAPQHRPVVEEVLAGEDSSTEVEPILGPEPDPPAAHELESLVMPDGGTEEVSGGGGGVELVALKLPSERLLRETRLAYVGDVASPKIVLEGGGERFATHNPEVAAEWLVDKGFRQPWHAELALTFEWFGDPVPPLFEEPVAQPPPGVGGV